MLGDLRRRPLAEGYAVSLECRTQFERQILEERALMNGDYYLPPDTF
jgi:hypothetical protein